MSMSEYDLACSVSHHFKPHVITDEEHEELEKQRLLTFPKHERSLWCWICGSVVDPCDYPTPRGGVEAFQAHLNACEDGWRKNSVW